MKSNRKAKTISGFFIAIFISFAFLLLSYYFYDAWLTVLFYFIFLFISLLIFHVWLRAQWILITFIPIFPILFLGMHCFQWKIRGILKKNKVRKNVLSRTVVVVTNFNFYEIDFYINASPTDSDVAWLIKYLFKFRKDFSFYLRPTRLDIEEIMLSKKVREVYFLGHGNSSGFQVNVADFLEYKDFNHKKYSKDFIHQIHCGSKYGKPLRSYVVPKRNWHRCFFIRKTMAEKDIVAYFKKKIALK